MFHFDDLTLDCRLDVSIVRQIHHVGTGNTACIGSSEIHLLARNFGGTVGIAALLALLALLPVMVLMLQTIQAQRIENSHEVMWIINGHATGSDKKWRYLQNIAVDGTVPPFLDPEILLGFRLSQIWFVAISDSWIPMDTKCHPHSPEVSWDLLGGSKQKKTPGKTTLGLAWKNLGSPLNLLVDCGLWSYSQNIWLFWDYAVPNFQTYPLVVSNVAMDFSQCLWVNHHNSSFNGPSMPLWKNQRLPSKRMIVNSIS